MRLFDNHNHSQFSFDGFRTSAEKSAKSAVERGLGGICFSDHCDIFPKGSCDNPFRDAFDVEAQQEEIDRVSGLMPEIKILKGIEIGVDRNCREEIADVLSRHSFDQIIASVHYLEGMDPYKGEYYEGRDWKETYSYYLEVLFGEMQWLGNRFDIMGHYDYIVRYAPYSKTGIMYRDFPDLMDSILKFLAENGKALEINTKTYQDFSGRTPVLDPDILKRYREFGGEILSLGSDSHFAEHVGFNFSRHTEFIKSLGFRYAAHYENRRLRMTTI